MSEASDIKQRILRGRQANFDWLPPDADLNAIALLLISFANANGGRVVIGVDGAPDTSSDTSSDARLTGVPHAAETIDCVLQVALTIEPALIMPLPHLCVVDGKTLVVIDIPDGLPHVYAYDGRYVVRRGIHVAPLHPPDLRQLMFERGEVSFETDIPHGATLDDIDWQKAYDYIKTLRNMSDDDAQNVLMRRGCLMRRGDALLPTHAGLLLFGKNPQQFIHGAEIMAVRFAGEAMSDTFTRQEITGTLEEQIRRAETFLIDHMRKDVRLAAQMARHEAYEYPLEAARELVVNAVAHRDYSIAGDHIRLFIFSNRMEIHSPGKLPGHMTVQNLRDERFSRNPVIVQVLSDMHYIERLGYGVDRVIDLLRTHNHPAPKFEEHSGGFRVVLHRAPDAALPQTTPITTGVRTIQPPSQEQLIFNGFYNGIEINPRQESALVYLHAQANSRITNSDLKAMFPDVHPETIRRDLVDLVSKDILVKLGQKRGSYYVLKSAVQHLPDDWFDES